MKKFFALFMSMLFVCGLAIPAIALNVKEQPNYYKTTDGKNIVYYLDNDGIPYIYENGKKETVLLPLEQFRITDPEECARLDAEFEIEKEEAKAMLKNLMKETKSSSRALFWNGNISLPGDVWLQIPQRTNAVVLKMSNPKPVFSNYNVNITFNYREKFTHNWFSETKNEQNLVLHEVKYPVDGEVIDGAKITISPRGGLKSAWLKGKTQMS